MITYTYIDMNIGGRECPVWEEMRWQQANCNYGGLIFYQASDHFSHHWQVSQLGWHGDWYHVTCDCAIWVESYMISKYEVLCNRLTKLVALS